MTEYYAIGHRLESWAERIPVQEAFSPQSGAQVGVLSYWQPWEPVSGAGSPVDWWLFLSPEPIEWGSLDDLPIHALVAHVSPINFPRTDEYDASGMVGRLAPRQGGQRDRGLAPARPDGTP